MDALEAIFIVANGKPMEMNNIITALTKKIVYMEEEVMFIVMSQLLLLI